MNDGGFGPWVEGLILAKENDIGILEPCRSCPHRTMIGHYHVCGCQCGRATRNSGHPLSPCHCDGGECRIGVDEMGALFCEEDEEAIAEGGRCYDYIGWLGAMDELNGGYYKYPQRFKKPIIEFED